MPGFDQHYHNRRGCVIVLVVIVVALALFAYLFLSAPPSQRAPSTSTGEAPVGRVDPPQR